MMLEHRAIRQSNERGSSTHRLKRGPLRRRVGWLDGCRRRVLHRLFGTSAPD